MNKSVYSLVLMDDVIDAIDRMACAEGTSRSSLINRILAQYVNLTTPEMRMKDIFSSMQQLIHDSLQLQFMPSDSMISIRSPLRYKYKPTIRYGLELYRSPGDYLGRLRVSFRTQNSSLLYIFEQFINLWVSLEQYYLKDNLSAPIRYELSDGRFTREILRPRTAGALSEAELGRLIADYVNLLDSMIKLYFEYAGDPPVAAAKVRDAYVDYLSDENFPLL